MGVAQGNNYRQL